MCGSNILVISSAEFRANISNQKKRYEAVFSQPTKVKPHCLGVFIIEIERVSDFGRPSSQRATLLLVIFASIHVIQWPEGKRDDFSPSQGDASEEASPRGSRNRKRVTSVGIRAKARGAPRSAARAHNIRATSPAACSQASAAPQKQAGRQFRIEPVAFENSDLYSDVRANTMDFFLYFLFLYFCISDFISMYFYKKYA